MGNGSLPYCWVKKNSWYDSMLHPISHSVLTIPNTKCRILDHWLLFPLLFEVRIGGHTGRHVRTICSHVFPGLSLVWPRHTMPPTGNPCPFFPHSIRLCRTNRINPRVVNSKGTASNMSSDFCYPVERALCKRQAAKKMCLCLCVCVCHAILSPVWSCFSIWGWQLGKQQAFERRELCRTSCPFCHLFSCKCVLTSLIDEPYCFVRVPQIVLGPWVFPTESACFQFKAVAQLLENLKCSALRISSARSCSDTLLL